MIRPEFPHRHQPTTIEWTNVVMKFLRHLGRGRSGSDHRQRCGADRPLLRWHASWVVERVKRNNCIGRRCGAGRWAATLWRRWCRCGCTSGRCALWAAIASRVHNRCRENAANCNTREPFADSFHLASDEIRTTKFPKLPVGHLLAETGRPWLERLQRDRDMWRGARYNRTNNAPAEARTDPHVRHQPAMAGKAGWQAGRPNRGSNYHGGGRIQLSPDCVRHLGLAATPSERLGGGRRSCDRPVGICLAILASYVVGGPGRR